MEDRVVVRLDSEQYSQLVKKIGYNAAIDNNSTVHTVAFKLGVQHALNVLREGYVVETPVSYTEQPTGIIPWLKRKWRALWAG